MNRLTHKKLNEARRQHRLRKVIIGTADKPRLVLSISNLHVSAQVIDDSAGKTLAYSTTVGSKASGTKTAKAEFVAIEIAKKAKKAGVSRVVFDRRGHKYHGRVKAFADKSRTEGLEF